ncbi:FmdB family zinc ribbon protein [Candidatus Margulisiibacteriota bacterium]
MPTYEYKCNKCNHRFEALQTMKEDPLIECPKCDGEIKRLIGRNVFVSFKGPGFYVTDNASKSAAGSTKS